MFIVFVKRAVCFVMLFWVGSSVSAQAIHELRGKIVDARSHEAVEYAPVTLFAANSSKAITGTITDSTGTFLLKDLQAGPYRVSIEAIGYAQKIVDSIVINDKEAAKNIGIIFLNAKANSLKRVTVTASAPIVETKIDKIVYNAANDVTSQGSTVLDMLRKVPQVTVDIDGAVELQGNANIRFLINGKPSSVFGASVTDALAAIPASQIQRIEAITTPGAKYDAQGTGGIINIILKESKVQGYNGNISVAAGTRLENGAVNLNLRKGAFGLSAFASGNAQLTSRTPSRQDRLSTDAAAQTTTRLLQDGYNDVDRNGAQAGISFDYTGGKNNFFNGGVSYNYFGNENRGSIRQQTIIRDAGGAQLSDISSLRNSDSRFKISSIDWNLSYQRKFRKEGQTLDVAYSSSYGMPDAFYSQSQTATGQSLPFTGSGSHNPGTDFQNNISLDYTQPVNDKISIETGLKAMLQTINSAADVSTLDAASNEYNADPTQSYHLDYKMNVWAGYLSASFPLFHFLDIKAGARYEYTAVNINYPNTTIPSYSIVVPSLILSHKFRNGQTLKIAYTRRIERAEYDELNPFVNRSDPYNLSTGNPLLAPEIGDNLELGYSKIFGKGSSLNVSLLERINSQDHKRIINYYPTYRVGDSLYQNVSVQTVQNTGTEYNSGINISGSLALKEKLNLRGNAMIFHRYLATNLPGGNLDIGFRLRLNLTAAYQFTPTLIAEAFGNYSSAAQNIQGKSPQWITYTLAIRKQFWDKKASLGLTATNPFNQYIRQVSTIAAEGYNSYVEREVPFRSFGISFALKFGRLEFKKEREEDNSYLNTPAGGTGN